jgi:hypothetical protein
LLEGLKPVARLRIALLVGKKHADAGNLLLLLRTRGERPSRGDTTEQRDELASLHSRPPDFAGHRTDSN